MDDAQGAGKSGEERRKGADRRNTQLEPREKARQEFFAALSHELRNPIHAIHTNALLIKSRTRDAEVARPAEAIDRQVSRLTKLLDDLLDVVRIAQREEMVMRTVTIQEVIGRAVETVRRSADTHRRELTVTCEDAPLYVNAEPARLEQAIAHVLANAVKYSGQQSEVQVRLAQEGEQAVVSVRDFGVGIAPGDLEGVFTRFIDGVGRKDVAGGLGIGLHIARELVQLHGGSIEARSEGLGKGSEFVIRIPLTGDRPAAESQARAQYADTKALRILVVDDNRDSADSLATLLEMHGHTGLVAYDGAGAIEKAEKMRPHVALLDIGMPTMNGYEVAERISKADWGRETVLVAVTGWGARSDRLKSKEAGFAYHLTKPVDYDTLASLLNNVSRKPAAKA
ncbi:MAG TPA: ATP-binding protein [Usitatibacter sp.]|nr:ATP-binding protein [Usitatibacter sp.]